MEFLDLLFLAFLRKSKENHPPKKKKGFFSLLRTPKIPGKEEKTLKKTRTFLAFAKKNRKSQKITRKNQGSQQY